MNLSRFRYKGNVKLKLKINDKVVELEVHNSGLPTLQRTFCKCLTGNQITVEDIPEYIDLRYSNSGDAWQSLLSARIHLSGKTFDYNAEQNNYVAKLTAVLSYTYFMRPVTKSDPGKYRLYLYSGSLGPDASTGLYTGYNDLAFIDVDNELLSYISPGTQAIVEWEMQLLTD